MQKLVDLRNEPLEIMDKDKKLVQATLCDVCSEAMLAVFDADAKEGGKVRYIRWQFAGKIINADGPLELSAEEIVTIKDRVGRMYGPAIVGPVYDLLEGKEDAKTKLQDDGQSLA